MPKNRKKTHNSEKFVNKVQFSMVPELIGKWLPDDEALQYIVKNSDKKLGELRAENKKNEETIKEQVGEFMDKGLAFIIDKSEVKVKQESPFKIADIVLYCHAKENEFTITLTNCVQTNRIWHLGDAFVPEGSGFESAVAAKENKKPGKFGQMLVKAGELQEEAEKKTKKKKLMLIPLGR